MQWWSPLPVAIAAVFSSPSVASAADPAPLIEWEAPTSCPSAAAVDERLTATLGFEPQTLGELSRVRASIRVANGKYRLALDVFERGGRHSSRLIESASCSELVDAAAIAITLALAPESHARAAPNVEGRAAASAPSIPADGGAAEGPFEAFDWDFFVSGSALIESGALPRPALGFDARLGTQLGAWSIAAFGVLLEPQRETVRPEQEVELGLLLVGLRGCRELLRARVMVAGCASFEAGRYAARGVSLQRDATQSDAWLAPAVSLELSGELIGPLGAVLRAESALPLTRKQYTVNGSEDVHASAPVSSRLSLGLSLSTD